MKSDRVTMLRKATRDMRACANRNPRLKKRKRYAKYLEKVIIVIEAQSRRLHAVTTKGEDDVRRTV